MNKNNYIRIRVTDKDKTILKTLADANGVTVSFYIRDLIYKDYLKNIGGKNG